MNTLNTSINENEILINLSFELKQQLLTLPFEILFQSLLLLSYNDIINFCLTSKEASNVCDSDYFWYQKFIYDYGYTPIFIKEKMKYVYLNQDTLWSFGYNGYGQLGLGDNIDRNRPTKISDIKVKSSVEIDATLSHQSTLLTLRVKAVACGLNYSMIIDMNDEVWSFGRNGYGQLGLGDNIDRNRPTKIGDIKVKSIACGWHHSMIILLY